MAKKIEPELVSITEYLKLKKATFNIPQYQRAYRWEITQCDKLWDDIWNYQSEGNDGYFLGTIILSCVEGDDNLQFDLIDGQQRTTTFLLLLKAFLMKINKEIKKSSENFDEDSKDLLGKLKDRRRDVMSILYNIDRDEVSSEVDEKKDRVLFEKIILTNNSNSENYKEELKVILSAFDAEEAQSKVHCITGKKSFANKYTNFYKNFSCLYGKADELSCITLNTVVKKFLEDCQVIRIKSWNEGQAIEMFNSLNSDGMPLSDADIIASKLYKYAKDKGFEEFNQSWIKLTKNIEELEKDSITDIDNILNQYMYYLRAKNGETKVGEDSVDVTVPGLRKYFTEINKDTIANPRAMVDDLSNLAEMWKVISEWTNVKVLLKLNSNSKLFLASYLFRFAKNDKDETRNEILVNKTKIGEIVDCLIRLFIVLEIGDFDYSSTKFKTFLFAEEIKFVENVSNEEISQDFNRNIEVICEKCQIDDAIKEYTKHTIVFVNEYLFAKEKGITNFDFDKNCDIEHIMPTSGKTNMSIRRDAMIGTDNGEEFDSYVNQVGNKILLEKKINRGIGANWFKEKLSLNNELKFGYKNSNCPIAQSMAEHYEKAENNPIWTKSDIEVATKKASDRIARFVLGK